MHRNETDFANPTIVRTGVHLGALVRQARVARRWTLAGLAQRSRISLATLKRIERGSVAASMGAWLAVLEHAGLIHHLMAIRDPTSEALLFDRQVKRSRKKAQQADLGF